jgi:hypothetical protein
MIDVQRPSARLIGGALVGVMVFGSALGAEAATKKKAKKRVVRHTRTVTLAYNGGCTAEISAGGATGGGSLGACSTVGAANWSLTAKPGEKYVTVSVADATGRSVPGQFWEKGSGTANDTEIPFCGAMKNYQFPVGGSILLDLDAAGAVAACPGFATQGTVTLVFSNLP